MISTSVFIYCLHKCMWIVLKIMIRHVKCRRIFNTLLACSLFTRSRCEPCTSKNVFLTTLLGMHDNLPHISLRSPHYRTRRRDRMCNPFLPTEASSWISGSCPPLLSSPSPSAWLHPWAWISRSCPSVWSNPPVSSGSCPSASVSSADSRSYSSVFLHSGSASTQTCRGQLSEQSIFKDVIHKLT